VIYGLAAALGWGVGDFGAAVVGRRLGSTATVVIAQLAGLFTLLVLLVVLRPTWSMTPGVVAGIAANGIIAAAAYLLLYRALEMGPVALVSPVVAAYAVITIALAIALLGEALPGIVLAGALTTVAGVVLTTADPRQLGRPGLSRQTGLRYAFGSMALFGVATFFLGRYSQEVGWLPSLTLSRISTTTSLVAAGLLVRPPIRRAAAGAVLGAIVVGIADVLGGSAYARGAELGFVSVVAAASATFTLIPVAGGVIFLKERPALSQGFGVLLVVAGLLMLGLGG
jgi:drug/metabolite transporter (DMT)-like permease